METFITPDTLGLLALAACIVAGLAGSWLVLLAIPVMVAAAMAR